VTQLQSNRPFNEYFSDLSQIVVLPESLSHTVYTQMSCSDRLDPRFEDTYESAWLIVDRLAMEDRAKMRLTHEMVDR
jgi:hypothetical protein